MIPEWRKHFPFAEPREQQVQAIEFALDQFLNHKKRFVLLDLPVGIGKSAIAVTIAKTISDLMPGDTSYLLTTQKVLQDQYVDDFAHAGVCSIKSASNYTCSFYAQQSCAESRRVLKMFSKKLKGSDFEQCCKRSCLYMEAKQEFIFSPVGVTNFSYFLSETMYAGQLKPRKLLAIDECHNVEAALSSHIEVAFSEKFAVQTLKCKGPKKKDIRSVFTWVKKTYKEALVKCKAELAIEIEASMNDEERLKRHSKQNEVLDKHLCKVNRFIKFYDEKNWIMNVSKLERGDGNRYEFKPIVVSSFTEGHLFKYGELILMMSGTILDRNAFCSSLGIPRDQAAYLSLPSPFPVENRPLFELFAGSMSRKSIDDTLPKLAVVVGELLKQHPNEKGMIHAQSFKVARFLQQHVPSRRLLVHDDTNRLEMLQRHLESKEPTVLVSPSMTEGINLIGDFSRFQVICKVPYPFLGDEAVKKRIELDPSWYDYQTVKTVVQALGRSIRTETDFAVSYIVDSDWRWFYGKTGHMFPLDFVKTLKRA